MTIPDLYRGPGDVTHLMTGKTYGWMDDQWPWVITAHTTETAGLPGYRSNTITPKITVFPKTEKVVQHVPLRAWSGSLVGSSTVQKNIGVWMPMNQKSVCVELVSYSDKRLVDQYGGDRLWVGDWTDHEFAFVADVFAYLMETYGIEESLHAMPAGQSWKYGTSSQFRMGTNVWPTWSGLTAHGGIPGQVHWDTGVLDLHKLWALMLGTEVPPPAVSDPNPQEDSVLTVLPTLRRGDGYESQGKKHMRPDVKRLQSWLAVAGYIAANTFNAQHVPDGIFGGGTETAVKAFQSAEGITVDGIAGPTTWKHLAQA